MKIKQDIEDFQVVEIPNREWAEKGRYWVYEVAKRNMNTSDMINALAMKNKTTPKTIHYAGLKDKRALTVQYITSEKELPYIPDNILIKHVGFSDDHLGLGDLQANAFRIKVEEVQGKREVCVINYFGDQRFSRQNVDVGLMLIKKNYLGACEQLVQQYPQIEADMLNGSGIQALHKIPRKILLLYVHAVQSWLWNEMVSAWIKDTISHEEVEYKHGILRFPKEAIENEAIPLLGAAQDAGKWEKYALPILEKAGITLADFINRQLPFLTQEGTVRDLVMDIQQKEISLNGDVAIAELVLGSGSYATVCVLAFLF